MVIKASFDNDLAHGLASNESWQSFAQWVEYNDTHGAMFDLVQSGQYDNIPVLYDELKCTLFAQEPKVVAVRRVAEDLETLLAANLHANQVKIVATKKP